MHVDGACRQETSAAAAGILIENSEGAMFCIGVNLGWGFTNNMAEYQSVLIGVRFLQCLNAECVEVFSDSQLVVEQFCQHFQLLNPLLKYYCNCLVSISACFDSFELSFVKRHLNTRADRLSKFALYSSFYQGCEIELEDCDPNSDLELCFHRLLLWKVKGVEFMRGKIMELQTKYKDCEFLLERYVKERVVAFNLPVVTHWDLPQQIMLL